MVLALCTGLWVVPAQAAQIHRAEVVQVDDGDTLHAVVEGRVVRVELARIDAPELRQDFGEEARSYLAERALSQQVELRVLDKDEGTWSAEVVLADGQDLNRELVQEGYAWWCCYQIRSPDDRELIALEEEARRNHRGLWGSTSEPEPPENWRKRKRPF